MANLQVLWRVGAAAAGLLVVSDAVPSDTNAWADAFRNGTPIADMRYRFESVSQDNALRDAEASTLRTRIGFVTDPIQPLSAVVEVENVLAIGSDRYNSTTNGRTEYSVVPDPETTEVNQAYLMLKLADTNLSIGRRRMVLDNGRFLGNTDFRQNEQTYDAVVLMNTSFPGHRLIYTYMDKAHRFLGDDSPQGELDMSSHFVNYRYQRLNNDELVLYAYLLEMDPAAIAQRSTKTFGLRYVGGADIATARFLYTLEYADQAPYADGNQRNNADYIFAEAGVRFPNQWVAKLGAERMGGDGSYGFQTPLATAQAFAGDADVFAGPTPPNGLVDRFVKLSAPLQPFSITLAYHDFESDRANLDYGTEWDVTLTRGFGEHVTVGAQFAAYDAKQFSVDTDKLWLWLAFQY